MSGQRSDWRERLRVNPSRMEQELAIKLQDDGIHPRNPDFSRVEESISVSHRRSQTSALGGERLSTRRRQQLGEVIQETRRHDVNDIKEGTDTMITRRSRLWRQGHRYRDNGCASPRNDLDRKHCPPMCWKYKHLCSS